jgi:hypothetical protein
MAILAGIDEAGLGPVLGPLVLSMTVFRAEEPGRLENLWRTLRRGVARARSRRKQGRIVVDDSKQVYRAGAGFPDLETSALALAALRGDDGAPPADLPSFAGRLFYAAVPAASPWDDPGASGLPLEATDGAAARARFRDSLASSGVELCDACVLAVPAARLNQGFRETSNKAYVHYKETARLLKRLFTAHGAESPEVVLDRHGGRKFYERLLKTTFLGARIATLEEEEDRSTYEVRAPGGSMRLTFLVEGDRASFPVAAASILAKYTRELYMRGLNRWFVERQPGLRPTAGYYNDAQRFLAETESLRRTLGIADEALIRAR